jgi:hypothetical protein
MEIYVRSHPSSPTRNGYCLQEIQKLTNMCGGSHAPVMVKVRLPAYISHEQLPASLRQQSLLLFRSYTGEPVRRTPPQVKRATQAQFLIRLFL